MQGTEADIIKIAMIRIADRLKEQGSGARMLLQVHDELLFEVPRGELDAVRSLVVELMENTFPLDVPLATASGAGETWYDCKG